MIHMNYQDATKEYQYEERAENYVYSLHKSECGLDIAYCEVFI